MIERLKRASGLVRSLIVYHGQPWRVWPLRRFMRELVEAGSLAFDIGAHAGNRTLALSKAGARVVAFEPQPVFQPLLRFIASRREIVVRTEAVGREAGATRLQISSRHPTLSSTAPGWPGMIGSADGFRSVEWDREIEVPVVTLDGLIAEYGRPDFVKIDVEGSEADVLEGLSEALPLIAFEYLPAAAEVTERCFDRLEKLGTYEFNLVIGETQRFIGQRWLGLEAFRSVLSAQTESGRSGDIYARLSPLDAPAGRASPGKANVRRPGSAPAVETRP